MGLVFFLGSGGRSQWSTLESGPLARSERLGKGLETWENGRASGPLWRVDH